MIVCLLIYETDKTAAADLVVLSLDVQQWEKFDIVFPVSFWLRILPKDSYFQLNELLSWWSWRGNSPVNRRRGFYFILLWTCHCGRSLNQSDFSHAANSHLPHTSDSVLISLVFWKELEILRWKYQRSDKFCKSLNNYYITNRCICWNKHLQYLAAKPYSCYSMLLKIITCSNNVYLQFTKDRSEDCMSLNTWTNIRFLKDYFPSTIP